MSSLSARAEHRPVSTPPRSRRSLRRTVSHDITRPDGLTGLMTARCRGRDLHTDADGGTATMQEVAIDARAGFDDGRVEHLATDAPGFDLEPLVGSAAFSGFRAAARRLVSGGQPASSLTYQLLDDLPIAFLLSGRVLRIEGIGLGVPGRRLPVDICAGWVDGGSLLAGFDEHGPPLHPGPPASPIERDDDPHAWHETDPLPPRSTGRRRRLDVSLDGDVAMIDSWFRDTHVDADGVETVVHEYAVRAEVDRGHGRFLRCEAAPGPLPYVECPGAAASAGRLVDLPVDGLRDRVSDAFTGPSTCTHLNDALRSLEALADLLASLEALDDETSGPGRARRRGHDGDGPTDSEDRA